MPPKITPLSRMKKKSPIQVAALFGVCVAGTAVMGCLRPTPWVIGNGGGGGGGGNGDAPSDGRSSPRRAADSSDTPAAAVKRSWRLLW